ncbi:MAG: class IIb bacteriocin, lactobin A/cerein 7B family [Christensenellaceae bacterium]|nr:class IIb bacteriocin, lactobin A/cerein 7B family [Christensenellaceae bacterium]
MNKNINYDIELNEEELENTNGGGIGLAILAGVTVYTFYKAKQYLTQKKIHDIKYGK